MLVKAFLSLMIVLVAADYIVTGGQYSSAVLTAIMHFGSWLAGAGRESIFSK